MAKDRDGMAKPAGFGVPPATEQAFVVELRGGPADGTALAGRVEHIASGAVTHFRTLPELVAFMRRLVEEAPR